TSVSVKARLEASNMVDGYANNASADAKEAASRAKSGKDFAIGALGSGSDYTPFLQHLGLTTLEVSYSGEEDQGGVYHSVYDSFDHYVRFGDPEFKYGIAEAQTVGRVVLRVANAPILPMRFGSVAETVEGYLKQVHDLVDGKRRKAEDLAQLLEKNAFALAADPTRPVAAPEREPDAPYLNFAPLDNVLLRLKKSTKSYDDAYAAYLARGAELSVTQRAQLNDLLRGMEQAL